MLLNIQGQIGHGGMRFAARSLLDIRQISRASPRQIQFVEADQHLVPGHVLTQQRRTTTAGGLKSENPQVAAMAEAVDIAYDRTVMKTSLGSAASAHMLPTPS